MSFTIVQAKFILLFAALNIISIKKISILKKELKIYSSIKSSNLAAISSSPFSIDRFLMYSLAKR